MRTLKIYKRLLKLLFITVVFFCFFSISFSQPVLPQRTITVRASQAIHFGTFCITGSSGGTITVGYDGTRSSTGSIVLLSKAPVAQPAVFEVKLCQGRNVTINYDPIITLTGSNGESFTLDIGPSEKGGNGVSFVTNNDCNFITPLRVGGTLHIPGTAIPGNYTGTFDITLEQQ